MDSKIQGMLPQGLKSTSYFVQLTARDPPFDGFPGRAPLQSSFPPGF